MVLRETFIYLFFRSGFLAIVFYLLFLHMNFEEMHRMMKFPIKQKFAILYIKKAAFYVYDGLIT